MNEARLAPELVVAGNLLVDDLVLEDGQTRMGEPGGGALYVSLAASLWGVKVGLVSLLGDDYPAHAIEALRAHAVDLEGVRPLDGPSRRTWLLYEKRGRQIVRQLGAPSHDAVSPGAADLPAAYLEAKVVHVCPAPFKYQSALVEAFRKSPVEVALDPHEPVREDNLDRWLALLEHVALFFVSHEELQLEGAEANPRAALGRLAGRGPMQSLLLKRGAVGGLFHDVNAGLWIPWTSRVTRLVDATGAGDAFAGGFLAGRLRREPWERALQRGVVAASFAIESWGPHALIAATPAAAERRMLDWYGAPATTAISREAHS